MAWVDAHGDSRWVFRGLGDEAFTLVPGAGRTSYKALNEKTILEIFERRATEFLDTQRMTEWDRLALAQHHGLPTRLLDWTTNPLIAAYFAVTAEPGPRDSGGPVPMRPPASSVPARVVAFTVKAHTVVDSLREPDPFALTEVKILLPRALTTRIVTQGGLFSVHHDPSVAWDEPLDDAAHRFDIPGEMRAFFQRKLFYFGIDAQRVMGGLDGLCARLAWQYYSLTGLGVVR